MKHYARTAALGVAAALAIGGLATSTASAQAAPAVATKASHPSAHVLADPGPECTGQPGACWEYFGWYWTYEACHNEGRAQLNQNPGRYDNYNCAGGHGAVVWLWLHRP